jgi:hypothetical protein
MSLSAEAIARARQADILAVAHDLGARLKRVGASEWAGFCPVCGGTDRFSVNTRKLRRRLSSGARSRLSPRA